jgi:hypothetical protein
MNVELGCKKTRPWFILRYYSVICPEGLGKIKKDSGFQTNLGREAPILEAGV